MPNTEIVKIATTKQTKQYAGTLQADAHAVFVRKMVTQMQKQMFEMTRSNLGF